MLSIKTKRNIWLVMTIVSVGIIVDRTICLIDGTKEWTALASAIAVFVLLLRGYLCFRKMSQSDGKAE